MSDSNSVFRAASFGFGIMILVTLEQVFEHINVLVNLLMDLIQIVNLLGYELQYFTVSCNVQSYSTLQLVVKRVVESFLWGFL